VAIWFGKATMRDFLLLSPAIVILIWAKDSLVKDFLHLFNFGSNANPS
jgi:hypothetical protein